MIREIDVSIIIPAFNAEKSLGRAINSCLRFERFKPRIIIINDGSKDATIKVLEQYGNSKQLTIINLSENQGVSNARNAGINEAVSDYILFLDADDYFLPNADVYIAKAITNNPNIDLYCFGYIINGKKSPKPKSDRLNMEFLRNKFSNTNTIIVKKNSMKEIRFDSKYRIGEDTLFWFTLLCNAKAKFFANEIACYEYQPKINLAINHPLLGQDLKKLGLTEMEQVEVRSIVSKDQNRRAAFSRIFSPIEAFNYLGLKGLLYWSLGPNNFAMAWRINRYFRK
ncbi:glycosyltransferase family 2 protein [Limnohabitans sp. 2KL-1]|uniref:glycosyltransferase family 2 protein n=1 Tax=Limnohabitans sp. 2KL-1 TaxID=1100699 RepID=UPI001304BAF4|nr:glycosyltransferase family 2 protein [Limnohabitans sp. 2KL-1]